MTAGNCLPQAGSGWRACLRLGFMRKGGRTVLHSRSHTGPLVVQKMLYPEPDDEVCHAIMVHPPGGIAGGDELTLEAELAQDARALLTTPGATKWYRSEGADAQQKLCFEVQQGACLEWLPQENIVFDGARSLAVTNVRLSEGAVYAGWEVTCLGRQASGEVWRHGLIGQETMIRRGAKPVWLERARFGPDDGVHSSLAGLNGARVMGAFVIAAGEIPAELLEECRALPLHHGVGGLTGLPAVFAARYVGDSAAAARDWFESLREVLRPWYLNRPAVRPRIWNT